MVLMRVVSIGIYFNPRSHKGSDWFYSGNYVHERISIHAPTRGATFHISKFHKCLNAFQSTLPQGERHLRDQFQYYLNSFQSTLPQGERPEEKAAADVRWNFNPRSHKGSDNVNRDWLINGDISIHAPTRGATSKTTLSFWIHSLFQSTLPQGERRCLARPDIIHIVNFNPRSHKGSDKEQG